MPFLYIKSDQSDDWIKSYGKNCCLGPLSKIEHISHMNLFKNYYFICVISNSTFDRPHTMICDHYYFHTLQEQHHIGGSII